MTDLVQMQFGSHVYGTAVATSDRDYKQVALPTALQILLQRAPRQTSHTTKADPHQKNTPADVDSQCLLLHHFIALLCAGRMLAWDMLFTPSSWYLQPPHRIWQACQAHRQHFVHADMHQVLLYCRQQASRYGIRGSRVALLRGLLGLLDPMPGAARLQDSRPALQAWIGQMQPALLALPPTTLTYDAAHLQICGRKFGWTMRVAPARTHLQVLVDKMGERAALAAQGRGVDFKSLMHATRVLYQAEELLGSGTITFPRPERALLRRIRTGMLAFAEVADIIEAKIDDVRQGMANTTLPATPDHAFADNFVGKHYRDVVLAASFD